MTTYQQRPGTGVLFRNDRKQSDNSPDYTGSLNVGGIDFYISGWVKNGAKAKFLSLSVKRAGEARTTNKSAVEPNDPFEL